MLAAMMKQQEAVRELLLDPSPCLNSVSAIWRQTIIIDRIWHVFVNLEPFQPNLFNRVFCLPFLCISIWQFYGFIRLWMAMICEDL